MLQGSERSRRPFQFDATRTMGTMRHSQATIRGLMIPGELKVAVLKMVTSETKWARARAKENIARW